VQRVLLITDNNCVARIVSTLIADNIINAVAKNVSGFAFTFIAPLGTEEY
jgi:flavoprotein